MSFFSCPLVHSWKLFHCQRLVRLFWECGLRHYGRRKETFQRRYVHHGRLEFFLSLIAGPFSFPTLQFSFSNAWTDKLGTEFEFELPSWKRPFNEPAVKFVFVFSSLFVSMGSITIGILNTPWLCAKEDAAAFWDPFAGDSVKVSGLSKDGISGFPPTLLNRSTLAVVLTFSPVVLFKKLRFFLCLRLTPIVLKKAVSQWCFFLNL